MQLGRGPDDGRRPKAYDAHADDDDDDGGSGGDGSRLDDYVDEDDNRPLANNEHGNGSLGRRVPPCRL